MTHYFKCANCFTNTKDIGTMNNKYKILIISDSNNRDLEIEGILGSAYELKTVKIDESPLQVVEQEPQPCMILITRSQLTDETYTLCNKVNNDPFLRNIPIIFIDNVKDLNSELKAIGLGAVDYLSRPLHSELTLTRIKRHMSTLMQMTILENESLRRSEELEQTQVSAIQQLSIAAEFKIHENSKHLIRVSHYAKIVAEALGLGEKWCDLIFNAAPMHDVGKLGIPDKILLKPGKLTPSEWKIIYKHPEMGAEIIGHCHSNLLKTAKEIALSHHEKWDGTGYPNKLVGEDIPLSGRIVAIADVFDALTTKQAHKPAWPQEDSLRFIEQNSGIHFDPKVVDALKSSIDKITEISERFAD